MDGFITLLNTISKSFIGFAASMLFQSSALIVILFVLDWILRKKVRAVFRYCIWMLVLVKLVLPTALSLPTSLNYWFGDRLANITKVSAIKNSIKTLPYLELNSKTASSEAIIAAAPSINVYPDSLTGVTTEPDLMVSHKVPVVSLTWQGLVFLTWVAAVVAMTLLLVQRTFFVRGIVSQSRKPDRKMVDVFEQCCKQMGIYRSIGLKVSPVTISPSVCGLFHPTILIPQDLPSKLNSEHLKSIFLHELAHIKRWDLWVSLFQAAVQIVYIYNPLLWVANAMIRKVREEAVDEMVLVAMGEEAEDYPEILLNISRLTFSRPALSLRLIGVVESKKALIRRIRYIVSRPLPKNAKLGFVNLLIIIVIAAVLLPMAKAEPGSQITQNTEQADKPLIKRYVFNGNNDFLRKLLRDNGIKPRTLDNPNPLPGDSIVFGRPIRWWSSPWAGKNDTEATAVEHFENFDRFMVIEPYRAHSWVKYLDVPIDPAKYQFAVLTYRASGINKIDPHEDYLLYLDDGSGPSYGGILPFAFEDLICDGQKHVLISDLSPMGPAGDIIGLSININSDNEGDAWFDLIDLRFETAQDKTQEVIDEERSYTVKVLDIDGRAIKDALVTVDAERTNWARSEYTDASGAVTLTPYKTKSGRHMFRITKENMIPVEIRDIPENDEPVIVVLEPAVTYGGFVIDEEGDPLPKAAVKINVNYKAPGDLWTRKDAEVLTDKNGFWESPPMPRPNSSVWHGGSFILGKTEGIKVSVAHLDYSQGRCYSAVFAPSPNQLEMKKVTFQLNYKEMITVKGIVTDQNGLPLEGVSLSESSNIYNEAISDQAGRFELFLPQGAECLVAFHRDYAPKVIQLADKAKTDIVTIHLEEGLPVYGKLVDAKGRPLSNAMVRVIYKNLSEEPRELFKTDEEGNFSFKASSVDNPVNFIFEKAGFVSISRTLVPSKKSQVITLTNDPQIDAAEEDNNDIRPYDPFKVFRRIS